MVKDFKLTDNEKEIGYYVGFISASFSFASMTSGKESFPYSTFYVTFIYVG
jgi:hypothetical protein